MRRVIAALRCIEDDGDTNGVCCSTQINKDETRAVRFELWSHHFLCRTAYLGLICSPEIA